MGYIGIIRGYIGVYIGDNGKENGNYYNGDIQGLGFRGLGILGLYIGVYIGDNGKENGNYYNGDI